MKNIKLGILEFGQSDKPNSMSIIEEILTYASKADELNFSRFWLTEHHNSYVHHAYNNPEVLIAIIAGITEQIKVGSVGSLIGYYSPYSLAQNYKLLNNIYNNRIDFGLSKGRPSNSHKHNFFNTNNQSFDNLNYLENLENICDLLQNELSNYEDKDIIIPPFRGEVPCLWHLTNSYSTMDLVIDKQLNICRSLMHGLDVFDINPAKETLAVIRDQFYTKHNKNIEVSAAIAISFSKSEKELEEINKSSINRKEALKILAVDFYSFQDQLLKFQDLYGIDEFIIYDTEKNIDKKIENLVLINDAMKLSNESLIKINSNLSK